MVCLTSLKDVRKVDESCTSIRFLCLIFLVLCPIFVDKCRIDFLIIILPSYGQEIFEVLRFLNNPIFVQQNTELDRKIRFRLDVNETKKFSLHLRLPFDTIR